MSTSTHRLRLGLEDLLEQPLRTVPVEIAPGADSLEVRLRYDRRQATVDLGCEGPAGWRGWSGGARDHFVIAAGTATPGYLPGPLEPGLWHVQLGLHQLPLEPVDIHVEVLTPATTPVPAEPDPPPAAATPRASARDLPAPAGLRWYAGDFHAHSTHSDGEQSLSELATLATGNGLDFLAVTEHNTISHLPHLPRVGARHDITLLPGQEVTTPTGHANAIGDIGWVDFRRHPDHWLEQVEADGGILSINHPLQEDHAWQHRMRRLPPALELWHVTWFLEPTATAPWTLLSRWPEGTILLGGSDYHHPRHGYVPGTPVTWVAAEDRSAEALLEGVRAGRTAITRLPIPQGPALVRLDDQLVAVDADAAVLRDVAGRSRLLHGDRVVIDDRWQGPYRLEAPDGTLLAISP